MKNTLTGIKKAVGEYNNYQGHAEIMMDTADNMVWCNRYASGGEWTRYDSDTVKRLIDKATVSMWERDNKTTMAEVKTLAAQGGERE